MLSDKAYMGPYEEMDREKLADLSYRKDHLLKLQETTWRLKSRALWLEAGDHNTKYFHSYANQRRVLSSIWELKNLAGEKIQHQADLELVARSHFADFFMKEPC